MKPKRLARTVIYQNPWVNLYIDQVEFPAGRLVEKHHFLDFEKEAVGVIVEDEQGQILLVHVYRYITDSIEWEIPAGGIEKGEAIVAAAQREVWEESGYETINHKSLYTYYPINGIANKIFHLVSCRAAAKTGEFDRNEVEAIRWVSKQEIKTMIKQNLLRDGFSLTGLLLHFQTNTGD